MPLVLAWKIFGGGRVRESDTRHRETLKWMDGVCFLLVLVFVVKSVVCPYYTNLVRDKM